jgi:hypothetical protein
MWRTKSSSSLEELLLCDEKLWIDIPEELPQLSPVFTNIHEYREVFAALLLEEARESVRSGFEQAEGNSESLFLSISFLFSISASGRRMSVTVTKISLGAEVTCTVSEGNSDELNRNVRPNTVVLIASKISRYTSRGPPAGPHALGIVLRTSLAATRRSVTVKLVSKDTSFLIPNSRPSFKRDADGQALCDTYWLLPSTKVSTFLQEFNALWSLEKLDTVRCLLTTHIIFSNTQHSVCYSPF